MLHRQNVHSVAIISTQSKKILVFISERTYEKRPKKKKKIVISGGRYGPLLRWLFPNQIHLKPLTKGGRLNLGEDLTGWKSLAIKVESSKGSNGYCTQVPSITDSLQVILFRSQFCHHMCKSK